MSPRDPREFNHARERAKERLSCNLTARRHKQILHQIVSGKAIFVSQCEGERSQWIVKIQGKKAKVVYDKKLSLIITVMSLSMSDWDILRAKGLA